MKGYLTVFNLKHVTVADTKSAQQLMEQRDLSVDKRLEKQAVGVVSTLQNSVGQDVELKKESFALKEN
jgi:hypothetical protein